MRLVVIVSLALCVHVCVCAPLIKVFCSGAPLFRGRVDSIVSPGVVSGHVHKVAGGSNFGADLASQTPVDIYNDMIASPCTTCSIGTVDLSAYWHPDLYYRWPNGTLSLVPTGGLTVYYLARSGSGAQANPDWRAFPKGFRMISGYPFRRTFNSSSMADKAISFACLSSTSGPETNDLNLTMTRYCNNGLRMQVHFPQCWDGVRLDTPNHADHVAFPIEHPDSGNCPSTHPVRIPALFFEAFYSVSSFPHGAAPYGDGQQHFVLACGDATGYGFHGDFLSGWNVDVLQAVLDDPSCDSTNTNNGNDVAKCAPVAKYLQDTPEGACSVNRRIPLNENIGNGGLIHALPGCNPITGFGQTPTICSAPTSATEKAPATVRFHLRSELTGKFWSCPALYANNPLTATLSNASSLTYYEVFLATAYQGSWVGLLNEGPTGEYVSANGPNSALMCNRGSVSNYEAFEFVSQSNGKVAILSKKNNQYLTANADGTVAPSSTTVGTAQLFTQVVPSGGSVF